MPLVKLVKWIFKSIFILTGLVSVFRCNSGYKEKDGKITFNGREITDKNFVVLNDVFAKDSAYIYYKDQVITDADIVTFQALDEQYAKDKNRVYYCDEYRESQNYFLTKRKTITIVDKAIADSFTSLGGGYAKDGRFAYFEGTAFPVKDIATFEGIDRYFSRDQMQAYFNRKPIAGSDGKTFEVIDYHYAKDKAQVYFYGHPGEVKEDIYILPCNPAAFQVLDYPFSKDDNQVVYENEKMPQVHIASFQVLKNGYSKDQNAVYFETQKIAGVDVTSFELYAANDSLTQDFYYARDKASVYWQHKQVKQADVNSFKVLGHGYGSDHTHVFYKTTILTGADPNSFTVYPHGFGDADAEDSRNKYNEGKMVVSE
ncbi:hypothetical protein GXP67_09325 [Rhodocytophaga rosea]|uniref:DKNYY family protein n=1 Tax=Rhodocytophaga rosea TaxID=2704465 RepID=A0A6C0GG90_9BACT|nr:DKNYY domain-containing protein [Rhodocytophaga rosea]QHT66844.1 hypothetical protein GXP67_09325 [Rhodocytophaga rosea]